MDISCRPNYLFFMMTGGEVTGSMICTCNCSSLGDEKDAIKPAAHIGVWGGEWNPLTERGYSNVQVTANYNVKRYEEEYLKAIFCALNVAEEKGLFLLSNVLLMISTSMAFND